MKILHDVMHLLYSNTFSAGIANDKEIEEHEKKHNEHVSCTNGELTEHSLHKLCFFLTQSNDYLHPSHRLTPNSVFVDCRGGFGKSLFHLRVHCATVFDKDHIPPRVIGIEIEKWRFEMSEKVQLALSRYNKDKFQMKTVELVKGSFNADVPLMKSATHLFLLDLLFHPDTLAILSSNVLNTEDSHWMVLISCLPPKVWMG